MRRFGFSRHSIKTLKEDIEELKQLQDLTSIKTIIATVSISLDGLEATHDRLRGREGAYQSALRTMKYLKEVGIYLSCNTRHRFHYRSG